MSRRDREGQGSRRATNRLGCLLDTMSPDTFRAGVLLHTGPRSLKVGDRLYSAPTDTLWRPTATRHN